jgi:hypothetical protein
VTKLKAQATMATIMIALVLYDFWDAIRALERSQR